MQYAQVMEGWFIARSNRFIVQAEADAAAVRLLAVTCRVEPDRVTAAGSLPIAL